MAKDREAHGARMANLHGVLAEKAKRALSGWRCRGMHRNWRACRLGRQCVMRYCESPRNVGSSGRRCNPPVKWAACWSTIESSPLASETVSMRMPSFWAAKTQFIEARC